MRDALRDEGGATVIESDSRGHTDIVTIREGMVGCAAGASSTMGDGARWVRCGEAAKWQMVQWKTAQ